MAKNYDQKLSLSKVHVQCTLHKKSQDVPLGADALHCMESLNIVFFFKCKNTVTQQKVKSNAHGDPQ